MSASDFRGYVLKNAVTNSTDNSFIAVETYSTTPNQREELVAYREENTRDLNRVTAQGKKTVITFSMIDMDLFKLERALNFFKTCMVNVEQRKCHLTYWNDEDMMYKTSYFYIPNWTFNVDRIESRNIYYKTMNVTLTEY